MGWLVSLWCSLCWVNHVLASAFYGAAFITLSFALFGTMFTFVTLCGGFISPFACVVPLSLCLVCCICFLLFPFATFNLCLAPHIPSLQPMEVLFELISAIELRLPTLFAYPCGLRLSS